MLFVKLRYLSILLFRWKQDTHNIENLNTNDEIVKSYKSICSLKQPDQDKCLHLTYVYAMLHEKLYKTNDFIDNALILDIDKKIVKIRVYNLHMNNLRRQQESQHCKFISYWKENTEISNFIFDFEEVTDSFFIDLITKVEYDEVRDGLNMLKTIPCKIEKISIVNSTSFRSLKLFLYLCKKLLSEKIQKRIEIFN